MKITVDPLKGYTDANAHRLFDATGIIPHFVQEAELKGTETAQATMDAMNDVYGFGMGDYNMLDGEGSVDSEGTYTYPEDPTLVPLVEFQFELDHNIKVWVYEHALVAVTDGTSTIMQRMD